MAQHGLDLDGKAVKKTKTNCSDTTEGPSERQKNQWLGLARLAICVAREGVARAVQR